MSNGNNLLKEVKNFGRDIVDELANQNTKDDLSVPRQMVFPEVLNTIKNIRPVLELKCVGGPNDGKVIVFPCPVGFGVTDGASYNDTELGVLGATASRITQDVLGRQSNVVGQGVFETIESEFEQQTPGPNRKAKGVAGVIMSILGLGGDLLKDIGAPDSLTQGVGTTLGITPNKNITTEFTGVGTRGFAFQYKLVPSSEAEGKIIGQITKFLRQSVYPIRIKSTGGLILRYPPRWKLRFLTKIGGKRLTHIPGIAECYLESFATTYNGSNSFYTDGVPVDTDISLTFKEIRGLTRDDILRLDAPGGGSTFNLEDLTPEEQRRFV